MFHFRALAFVKVHGIKGLKANWDDEGFFFLQEIICILEIKFLSAASGCL